MFYDRFFRDEEGRAARMTHFAVPRLPSRLPIFLRGPLQKSQQLGNNLTNVCDIAPTSGPGNGRSLVRVCRFPTMVHGSSVLVHAAFPIAAALAFRAPSRRDPTRLTEAEEKGAPRGVVTMNSYWRPGSTSGIRPALNRDERFISWSGTESHHDCSRPSAGRRHTRSCAILRRRRACPVVGTKKQRSIHLRRCQRRGCIRDQRWLGGFLTNLSRSRIAQPSDELHERMRR